MLCIPINQAQKTVTIFWLWTVRRNRHTVLSRRLFECEGQFMTCECLRLMIGFQLLTIKAVFMKKKKVRKKNNTFKSWMCKLHFVPSNEKKKSDEMCFQRHCMTQRWKNEALQKTSCRVYRTSCPAAFVTREIANHQTWVGNKTSSSPSYKFLTAYHWLPYISSLR